VLAAVQRRREFPTRITQAVQVGLHKKDSPESSNSGPLQAPGSSKPPSVFPVFTGR
jgi:hypothetical protein